MSELKMSEAQLQQAVTDLCQLLGLWWYHTHDSRRSNSGWPDLVILGQSRYEWAVDGDHGALFVELKAEDGRRSRAQIRCAERIELAGLQYRLWRPSDLHCGIIKSELEAIR